MCIRDRVKPQNVFISLTEWSLCFRQHISELDETFQAIKCIARFCRATLSRDKVASGTWRFAQLLNSRATSLPIRAALYSVQLHRENAVNADWSILVYAAKLQCATRHVTLAILSRDKVARQNHAIKLQVWHQSKYSVRQNRQNGQKFVFNLKSKQKAKNPHRLTIMTNVMLPTSKIFLEIRDVSLDLYEDMARWLLHTIVTWDR